MIDPSALLGLLVAALGGAAIGVERQQSGHASGRNARFAGIRTFTLLGGVSGMAGFLAASGHTPLAIVVLAGPVALTIAAYVAGSRHDIDGTTEAAALVAIAAGALAGLGAMAVASGIIAITVFLLVEKSRLHSFIGRIDDEELRAAARFAVMAVVILPILPTGPFGGFVRIKPQELWLLVLFFTGLSFTGYLARRLLGETVGYPVTGALAGLVSSTNAVFIFSRLSRSQHARARTLACAATAACTVLFPRVLVATLVLDPSVAWALLGYLTLPFVTGIVAVSFWLRPEHQGSTSTVPSSAANPLQFLPALQMALTFQVVLMIVASVRRYWGQTGLTVTAAALGLTDVDALTISMARSAADGMAADAAARAIAVGILSNCVLKGAVATVLGSKGFAMRTVGALAVMIVAIAAALYVVR